MATLPEFVYVFDINRRVYRPSVEGRISGGPIYRQHWREYRVIGEEKRSWLVERWPHKIAKAAAKVAAQVDDDCWINDNAHRVADMVRRADAPTLRAIAELVGFKEGTHGEN